MISRRLTELRGLLLRNNFTGYIVPSCDEYLSEYVPEYAERLRYITGFTGSNGIAIILEDIVLFFTDGRYMSQSATELDQKLFKLFNQSELKNFPWQDYNILNTGGGKKNLIAYDPKIFTNQLLKHFNGLALYPYKGNLIDQIWHNQPDKPNSLIYDYNIKFAGISSQEKIERCKMFINYHNASSLLITNPESVCWLLNIRAHDIKYSPILLAHVILTQDTIYLFTDATRLDSSFNRLNITILPEDQLNHIIHNMQDTIIFDSKSCSNYIYDLVTQKQYLDTTNPCNLWKACKNDTEITCIQQAHIDDAVAVCEILAYIESYSNDAEPLTEYDIGIKLTALRARSDNYLFDSFPTICGYRQNGAVIHYQAQHNSAAKIQGSGLLLIDSGGQYNGATTDITRTIPIGDISSDLHTQYKYYYTKVLKGHIALSATTFPEDGVSGAHIDILARQYLWDIGEDYAHGTGHGVGSFLSVHEGPQNISLFSFDTKLAKNMVLSNEPGYYKAGDFGIRIENMMYVTNANFKKFLKFETLTLVPYSKELIDFDLLNNEEIKYLKLYYSQIRQKILPLLSISAQKWLIKQIENFYEK